MMKPIFFATLALVLTAATQAATTITETFTNTTGSIIPDGDLSGLVQTLTPATTIATIDFITVSLNTRGGWNGDLYAYLWHGGEISVLLNRSGRTAGDTAGSATAGYTVTFDALALTDIHSAPGGFDTPISGTFQPDGRAIHPLSALGTSPRTKPLSIFNGAAATGDYRLFIADVASGDTATLTSWSVAITGSQIPEPSAALLLGFSSLVLLRRRRQVGFSVISIQHRPTQ